MKEIELNDKKLISGEKNETGPYTNGISGGKPGVRLNVAGKRMETGLHTLEIPFRGVFPIVIRIKYTVKQV